MASAFEHKSLRWLRERFEQGDVPTGYDFARLIDSCHNSLAGTDVIMTGNLTVSGDITCLGDITGTQSTITNDPRVDQLMSLIQANSGSWGGTSSTTTSMFIRSLEYLYEKFEDGDTPDELDFRLLINSSHNTFAHTNPQIAHIITTVQTNSASWAEDTGGGGSADIAELKTLISTNSADWSAHTDISDITTVVSTNSASWALTVPPTLQDVYSVVSTNSAGWSSSLSVLDRDTLTAVQTNSATWGTHTDIGPLTTLVRDNSASWGVDTVTDIEPLTTVVQNNSASWAAGGGSGGSVGAFVTSITCDGITNITEDDDEVRVGGKRPVIHALVDQPIVTFELQWEGPASEWTGTPVINDVSVPRNTTVAIAGDHSRRFQGEVTLDLTEFQGQTKTIYYTYQGDQKSVDVQIAGGGPVVKRIEFLSTPQHGQDHYKHGDNIQFRVEFDTSDVSSVSVGGGSNHASKTYNDMSVTMDGVSATIDVQCETNVTTITDQPVRVKAKNALGTESADWFESTDMVSVLNGPVVESVTYGAYPGTQTELKDGDTISATFRFDTNNVDHVNLDGSNDNNFASSDQTITVSTADYVATANITIDTSLQNNTGGFDRPVKVRAKKNSQQYGNWNTNTNLLKVNNQPPTFSNGDVTYPENQQALKEQETATVNLTVSNQGAEPTYNYTTPQNQISIPEPSTYSENKNVTRVAGDYNISSNNYRLQVTRKENAKSATKSIVVKIADADPTININTNNNTRMRSGGNDNTTQQNYNVVISSNQLLKQAPTLSAPVGTLGEFNYNNNSTTFTATIGVHDNDVKGTHTYTGLTAVNLANRTTQTITSGEQYTFGGFVSRTVPLLAFQNEATINVLWSTYNKLTINWSKDSAVSNRLQPGTTAQTTDSWCILDQTTSNTGTIPIIVKILDYSKTNAVSEDSTITVQEAV